MKVDTKTLILMTAEKLTKQRGFDAFSFRDISAVVGIKTASIHYYFPSKADLAAALAERYTNNFVELLKKIDAFKKKGFQRLEELFRLLVEMSGVEFDFCLCGMLAAEKYSVSESVHEKLRNFFSLFEIWIAKTLKLGIKDHTIVANIDVKKQAEAIVAIVEGTMLLARVQANYLSVFQTVLAQLKGKN